MNPFPPGPLIHHECSFEFYENSRSYKKVKVINIRQYYKIESFFLYFAEMLLGCCLHS
jgi:hypothetical protein